MMRSALACLIAVLVLVAAAPSPSRQRRADETRTELDEAIMKLLDKLKSVVQPLIDPLNVKKEIILDKLSSDKLKIENSLIKNMRVEKLSNFAVSDFHTDLADLKFRIVLGFDKVNAFGDYKVDAHAAGLIDVTGDGAFSVQLGGLKIDALIAVTYEDKHFKLNDIEVELDLNKLTTILSNLFGDQAVSELLSGIISDVGPEFIKEFEPEIKNIISVQGKELINTQLATLDINTLIDTIAGALGA